MYSFSRKTPLLVGMGMRRHIIDPKIGFFVKLSMALGKDHVFKLFKCEMSGFNKYNDES